MAATLVKPVQTDRIVYLDAARAIVMLTGVLTHATMIGSSSFFDAVTLTGSFFRMKSFFVISGFFGAMVLAKRGTRTFWALRFQSLLWPLATGLVLIVPLTLWLMALWHYGPISPLSWLQDAGWASSFPQPARPLLHLFFLAILLVYTLALPLLMWALRSSVVSAWARGLEAGAGHWGLWGHVLLMSVLMMATWWLYLALFGPDFDKGEAGWLLAMVFQYAPWFGLGALMFQYRPLFDVFGDVPVRHVLGGLMVCAGAFAAVSWLGTAWPNSVQILINWTSRSGLMVFGFAALLQLCRRWFGHDRPLLRLLVDSALTFYLIHIALIFLIVNLVGKDLLGLGGLYILVLLLVPPLGIWLHVALVSRSPVLQLLLIGKRQASAPVPAFR